MALRDDLESGESYYIVEIRSLKRILDESKKDGNILCIIDEVLRGTNTIERIGASSRILGMLKKENVSKVPEHSRPVFICPVYNIRYCLQIKTIGEILPLDQTWSCRRK